MKTIEQENEQKVVDETTKKKVRRRALVDQILADASDGAAQYVENYDAGRGAE
jgi:hypothetical protein